MTTFKQIHFLTAYPPSNLNRDDLGRPKSAIIGGTTRLRISSQSLKRAWRTSEVFAERLDGNIGTRTKEIGILVYKSLIEKGVSEAKSREYGQMIGGHFGKLQKEDKKDPMKGMRSEQLFYFSPRELNAINALIVRIAAGEEISKELIVETLIHEGGAADIALFGRMLASKDNQADYTVEAAAQVAHPFSVQRVSIEDDYFTAVDDLNKGEGAGHIGVAEFSSGLFYGYVCVNQDLLLENLRGDKALARATLQALLESIATIAPSGKQNSYGSRAYASYVMAERGSRQPRSLSVAYLSPITDTKDMLRAAIERIEDVRTSMDSTFGACAEAVRVLNVPAKAGTLADLMSFIVEDIHG
jgi:CRISPR system Cascade subunit CasC